SPIRDLLDRDFFDRDGTTGQPGDRRPDHERSGTVLSLLDHRLTIGHLLTHTGGFEDYIDEADDSDPNDFVLDVPVHTLTTAEAFIPLLTKLRQTSAPGSGFAYSNAGYVILA